MHKEHKLRIETPIGSRMLDLRLGPAAPGAAIRIGVGMSGVEALGDEFVEGDALGFERPIACSMVEHSHAILPRSLSERRGRALTTPPRTSFSGFLFRPRGRLANGYGGRHHPLGFFETAVLMAAESVDRKFERAKFGFLFGAVEAGKPKALAVNEAEIRFRPLSSQPAPTARHYE